MTKKHFTLMELLIVIAIIAILFSMLMPSFLKSKQKAKQVICMNNLKQLHMGLTVQAKGNLNKLPKGQIQFGRPDGGESIMKLSFGEWYGHGTLMRDDFFPVEQARNYTKCPSKTGPASGNPNLYNYFPEGGAHHFISDYLYRQTVGESVSVSGRRVPRASKDSGNTTLMACDFSAARGSSKHKTAYPAIRLDGGAFIYNDPSRYFINQNIKHWGWDGWQAIEMGFRQFDLQK